MLKSELTLQPVDTIEVSLEFEGSTLVLESDTTTLQFELIPIITADSGDKHYRHVQGTASDQWIINHNLGKSPAVTVKDSTGAEVEGAIQHLSSNQTIITFVGAFSGEATFN